MVTNPQVLWFKNLGFSMSLVRKFKVDRESGVPFAEQIFAYYAGAIRESGIPLGTKLPSIRDLAADLGINKIAIVAAYERLVAEGLISARPGSGYFAAWKPLAATKPQVKSAQPIEQGFRGASHIAAVLTVEKAVTSLDPKHFEDTPHDWKTITHLGAAYAPFDQIPMDDIRSVARTALHEGSLSNIAFEHVAGVPEFRRRLVTEMQTRGVPVADHEQVLVTTGVLSTINLVVESLLKEGDALAVEVPSYGLLFPLLRDKGIRIVPVPRNFEGFDFSPQVLSEIRRVRPKLFVVNPNFHNPTGGVLDTRHRYEILHLAQEVDAYVLEMDIYYGLGFGEVLPPTLAAMDGLQRVIYFSSFSRTIAAGLRVSFVAAAPHVVSRLLHRKILADVTCSNSDQVLVSELLARGLWRKHLGRLRDVLRSRRDTMISMLRKLAPTGSTWTIPDGGNFLWFSFPEGATPGEIQKIAMERHIAIAPADLFYPDPVESSHMRLSYGMLEPVSTYHALETLFAIWRNATTWNGRTRPRSRGGE